MGKFALQGLTKVLKTEYCDENYNYKQTQPKFKNGKVYYQAAFEDASIVNPWVVGSWHLTEIEDALTHRKIFFNYAMRNINAYAGEDISYNVTNKDYGIVSRRKSITQTPEISSVVYPDGHTVTVNYGNARIDLNGALAISSVDITYQGRYLSKYELKTSYFILNRYGTPVTDYEKRVARLCLRSVKKIGVDLKEDTPPYIFDYYTGSSAPDDFVPPPFSYAKDNWGFFNGRNTKGYWYEEDFSLTANVNTLKNYNYIRGLCYMRTGVSGVFLNAKNGYAKNGLLKQIVYPTAGTLTYQYAQNTGVLNGNTTNVGGVHVIQTSSTDGGIFNNCSNPIVTNYNYVMNGTGSASSLWGLEMPVNSMVSYNHYQPEYKSYKWSLSNCGIFGCCYWHFQYPGIMSQQQAINMAGWQKALEAISPVLGILSVLGTINDVATVIGGGSPVSMIIDIISGLATLAITCIGDQSRDNTATIYFNTDLNSAAPLPTQFKRVEVVESPGGIGKTVQEFTSSDDYAIWEPTNPVYSAKQRFAPWAYGLPKKTTVYDANGYIVKSTTNNYSFGDIVGGGGHGEPPIYKAKVPLQVKSCKCEVTKSSSQRSTKWIDYTTYNPGYQTSSGPDMKVDIYNMYTGRVELKSTSEKIYRPNSNTNFLETTTEYEYNTWNNYEVNQIRTTQSNGNVSQKNITYTTDYSGGPIAILLQSNIVTLPVQTANRLYNGVGWYDLDEKVTEFVQLSNGDIKPLRTLAQRFSQPQNAGTMTYYQGPGSNISNYKITQQFTYDASGNLVGLKDEGGRTVTNIFDYNDKYIVASVINSNPNEGSLGDNAAYSSFETTGLGGWAPGGSTAYNTSTAITGTRSFILSGGNSLSNPGLIATRPHTLSFWATTAGITVSGGATLIKSAPTYNGFTYYEYDIAQGITSVTVSGSGTIDELRVYPKAARMRTTTYDPLIGKTSDCDENNRITYYEYDNLGRLRFIKDEKKNIVKMHEYNNVSAGKQNGCPGLYHNYLISEIFTRNNCGAGYQGGEVVYTVPANTYSSSISQEEADAQAENYLLTYGQGYANANGTCHLLYYNAAISRTDTTQNCGPGYVGGLVTYTIPYGRYTSIISQADADEKALEELEANAQAWANDPAHAICIPTTDPDWTWLEYAAWNCQIVNGQKHLFVFETDMNPNSPTYQQTRWSDVGPNEEYCPTQTCTNCTGQGYACIYGNCELGVRINTYSYEIYPGVWECIYHYEFSDGSWSQNYTEYNSQPCAI
jgi:YD repeat-containing protein